MNRSGASEPTLRTELNRIYNLNAQFQELAVDSSDDSNVQFVDAQNIVTVLGEDVEETVKLIQKEDDDRQLYTLDSSNTNPVKLPVFEGKDSEDYSSWKETVLRCFVQNVISVCYYIIINNYIT